MHKNNNDNRAPGAVSPAAAVQRLIQVSQKLVDIGERETQALLQNDIMTFSILQDEKESVTSQYTAASNDFRSRLEDFRGVEKNLLGRLETLQKNIAEKARSNNTIIMRMKSRLTPCGLHCEGNYFIAYAFSMILRPMTVRTTSQTRQ